jgi:outer membrane receptor protein involved in Fe transport
MSALAYLSARVAHTMLPAPTSLGRSTPALSPASCAPGRSPGQSAFAGARKVAAAFAAVVRKYGGAIVICAAVLLLYPLASTAQEPRRTGATVTGRVIDASSSAAIAAAEVMIEGTSIRALSDSVGRYLLGRVPAGPQMLVVSALGYARSRIPLNVPGAGILVQDVQLAVRPLQMEGLIVVADPSSRARGELGTASVVDEQAIANQTAASLQGVLELIPGETLKPPGLDNLQQISLRAVPTSTSPSMTLGEPLAGDLASFGTLIIMDGVPISNNANLQSLGPRGEMRITSSAGGGIDLRRVPASTIERVEVIRGVPSARYGDLTQGVIVVDTRASVVAPTVAARYDAHLLEGSLIGGRQFGLPHALTANVDLASNQISPGINDDNAYRVSAQLAHRLALGGDAAVRGESGWSVFDTRVDFYQVYEDNPEDPEVFPGRASWGRDMGLRLSERARLPLGDLGTLAITGSLDYTRQRNYRQALLVRGAMPFTDQLEEGRAFGRFIGGEYLSRLWLEGDSWQLYTRVEAAQPTWLLGLDQRARAGLELRREWNSGPGYRFDIEFPPQVTFNGVNGFDRPASFDAIPGVATTTAYLDDRIRAVLPGAMPLELQAGLRLDLLHDGEHWFSGIRDAVLQPRLNAQLAPWPWLRLRGAWGRTGKQPPLAQVYPPPQYYDVVNVNWYANDPAERLAVLTTFTRDPTNHELGYATARKAEAGIELAPAAGFGLNLVAFSDRTTGGVGYRSVPDFLIREHFQLSDSTQGTGVPPEIIEPASYADTVPVLIHVPDNNLTLESKGFEGTLDLPEFRPIRTKLNVQASWIETRYFKRGIDFGLLFSEFQLSEHIPRSPYWEDPIRTGKLGLITYRLIHHQPALGLVITGTIQHTFKETERDIAATDSLAFAGYITRNGELVPVPPERRGDPEFEDLRQTRSGVFQIEEYERPADWIASLQVSKTLPRGGRLSFYAFNVLDRPGRFSESGFGSRVYPSLRFGLEVSLPVGGPG